MKKKKLTKINAPVPAPWCILYCCAPGRIQAHDSKRHHNWPVVYFLQ